MRSIFGKISIGYFVILALLIISTSISLYSHFTIQASGNPSIFQTLSFSPFIHIVILLTAIIVSIILCKKTTQSIQAPIESATSSIKKINVGEDDAMIDTPDIPEFKSLHNAISKTQNTIQITAKENEEQQWVYKGLNQLNLVLNENIEPKKQSNNIIHFLAAYLNAEAGAMYLKEKKEITLTDAYPISSKFQLKNLKTGNETINLAAKEKKVLIYENQSDQQTVSNSSFTNSFRNLVVIPFTYENKTLGILELGFNRVLEPFEKEFINDSKISIGIALHSARSKNKIEKLYLEAKDKTYKLQNAKKVIEQQLEGLNDVALVSITDIDGNITYVNDKFSKISKYSKKELLGQNHRILKSGKQSDNIFVGMWKAISMGKVWNGEIVNKAKDGTYYWVDTTIIPILDLDNQIKKYLSVRFDITNLKNQQEHLKELNNELKSFSYTVSHDLRAPLRAIHGFSEIIVKKYKEQFDEDGQRYLDNIMSNASKMSQLIDDILTFSRLGRQALSTSKVDLNELFDEIYESLGESYDLSKVEFTRKELPPVEADYSLLKQVAQNLVSNALKYSRNVDQPKVEVGAIKQGRQIVYYVKDNGTGFNMKYYDKLFGLFQRLHTQSEFNGNGIGLAFVKKIINRHEGKIWAESKEDEGSTFYFTINDKNKS